MADDLDLEEGDLDLDSPPKKAGMMPILMAVAACAAGGAGGMFVLGGPTGAWMAAKASADPGESAEDEDDGHGGGGHGGGGAVASIHTIENLVVNPANSDGGRYLLASVALEPTDAGVVAELAARDVAIRHCLNTFFGTKTVQELANIAGRDALIAELMTTLEHELGEGMIHRIYLPQYVIQ